MEIPEDIKDPEGNFDILTEEECKTIFEYNNGCVESCLEFDGKEEC